MSETKLHHMCEVHVQDKDWLINWLAPFESHCLCRQQVACCNYRYIDEWKVDVIVADGDG